MGAPPGAPWCSTPYAAFVLACVAQPQLRHRVAGPSVPAEHRRSRAHRAPPKPCISAIAPAEAAALFGRYLAADNPPKVKGSRTGAN